MFLSKNVEDKLHPKKRRIVNNIWQVDLYWQPKIISKFPITITQKYFFKPGKIQQKDVSEWSPEILQTWFLALTQSNKRQIFEQLQIQVKIFIQIMILISISCLNNSILSYTLYMIKLPYNSVSIVLCLCSSLLSCLFPGELSRTSLSSN